MSGEINNIIRYSMESELSGAIFTFEDEPKKFSGELKALLNLGFKLVGVEGLNGFSCPASNKVFSHDEKWRLV